MARYRLQKRAERQEETRRRITEVAVRLHETVGPARTTISDIARLAGVERLTVYRHFPDDTALFTACREHYLAAHPPPDPTPVFTRTEPAARVRAVLEMLYPYYRRVAPMLGNTLRDADARPALRAVAVEPLARQMAELGDALTAGWRVKGKRRARLAATIGLALDFGTWRRFGAFGMRDDEAAGLMADIAACVASATPGPTYRSGPQPTASRS